MPGNAHVGNHHAEIPTAQSFQRLFARGHRHGLEPLATQERVEQAPLAGIVIHDQDARRSGAILASFGGMSWNLPVGEELAKRGDLGPRRSAGFPALLCLRLFPSAFLASAISNLPSLGCRPAALC